MITKEKETINYTVNLLSDFYEQYSVVIPVVIEAQEKTIPDSDCVKYIHPLPHRDAGYIWCGWWVIDEIINVELLGINWRLPEQNGLKYKCDLETVALLLEKYPNAEMQESRNGYIFDREAILINKGP